MAAWPTELATEISRFWVPSCSGMARKAGRGALAWAGCCGCCRWQGGGSGGALVGRVCPRPTPLSPGRGTPCGRRPSATAPPTTSGSSSRSSAAGRARQGQAGSVGVMPGCMASYVPGAAHHSSWSSSSWHRGTGWALAGGGQQPAASPCLVWLAHGDAHVGGGLDQQRVALPAPRGRQAEGGSGMGWEAWVFVGPGCQACPHVWWPHRTSAALPLPRTSAMRRRGGACSCQRTGPGMRQGQPALWWQTQRSPHQRPSAGSHRCTVGGSRL